jgi:2-polyprenyl-3-methyl-5-hydroxy-6-metoxy-1,4-benzoquinol methylase
MGTGVNPDAYREMAATEDQHWWFAGRRAVLASVLQTMRLTPAARILEIGAGSGGNLGLLARFGQVTGLEMDMEACALAKSKAPSVDVRLGVFPADDLLSGERYDLVCMLDVLEHMDDDVAALAASRSILAPGGRLLLTVPAHPWLWSGHDVFLHHKRRYTRRALRRAASSAGFRVEKCSALNCLLYPLLIAVRCWGRLRGGLPAGGAMPPAPLNALLRWIFSLERKAVAGWGLPFGASLLAVLRPASGND